jgi:hypothetical protein
MLSHTSSAVCTKSSLGQPTTTGSPVSELTYYGLWRGRKKKDLKLDKEGFNMVRL